jgi:hypothetical protein
VRDIALCIIEIRPPAFSKTLWYGVTGCGVVICGMWTKYCDSKGAMTVFSMLMRIGQTALG